MFRKDYPDRTSILPEPTASPKRKAFSLSWSLMILAEVFVYSTYSILVNLSKDKGELPYSTSSLVLMMETTKLVISAAMFFPEFKSLGYRFPRIHWPSMFAMCIPGVLYSVNNNLAIHMQLHMDPTTFQVLSNMKLVATAVFYKYIMKRNKAPRTWIALGLLLIAAICDSVGGFHTKQMDNPKQIYITLPGLAMMTVFCMSSGLASVSAEYILKQQLKTSIHIQNFSLYFFCILINGTSWTFQTWMQEGPKKAFFDGFNIYTVLLIISQATNGLIMSAIIKHGSSITRIFVVTCAMPINTLLTMAIFGTHISGFFVISALMMAVALYLYHK